MTLAGIIDDYFDGYFSEEMIVPGIVMLAVLSFNACICHCDTRVLPDFAMFVIQSDHD